VSEPQGGEGRRRLVALLVLLAVAAPLVLVALLTGGDDAPATGLRIERAAAQDSAIAQIVVYVDDPAANVPESADGPNVELQCLDRDGRIVVRAVHPWPFSDTDQGTLDPHIHQNVNAREAPRIVRCRLNGTDGPFQGRP
jgi:hypothetical protein